MFLDNNIQDYMDDIAFNFEDQENDNQGIEDQENEDKIGAIKMFIKENHALISSAILDWMFGNKQVNEDQTRIYLLQSYVESLHLASTEIKNREMLCENMD